MDMAAAAESQSQFHVLAVDDSLIDRKLIERLLKTSSYQVTTVDSGSKALEFLGLHEEEASNPSISSNNHQEVHVNLIITDYCMPGMTGYDLLKRIKESSSLRNIPVVIMSSENVPSRISRCLEEGAKEFFLKPVRLSDLNKLKPHIMKTKFKDENKQQSQQQQQESYKSDFKSPSQLQQQQLQQQQQQQPQQSQHSQQQYQQPLQQSKLSQQQQQQLQQQSNNKNKRKALEEGLSPGRTRPRYKGIATVV